MLCAAGQGRRMALGKNKIFTELLGAPLLSYVLKMWESFDEVSKIIVVASPGEETEIQRIVDKLQLNKPVQLASGGKERQESVYNGLLVLRDDQPDVVLVHDAARPLTKEEEIRRVMNKASSAGAATLAVPVKDTIKKANPDGTVQETLNREELWAIQTPQAFHYKLLLKAHQQAIETGCLATDDASLIEQLGQPVQLVEGSYENLKITTPEDIIVAEALLNKRGR